MNLSKQTFAWTQIEKDCKTLANKLNGQKIDLIVAITKGGLPPAVILANKYLGKPHIITLQLEEIQEEGKAGYDSKKVKIISELNIYPIKGKRVLIVDDVADTGSTLQKAIELVNQRQPGKVTIAVLHYKPRSQVKPDIFARRISP
jgi:hypoxanthine phosphoribosyltransferase